MSKKLCFVESVFSPREGELTYVSLVKVNSEYEEGKGEEEGEMIELALGRDQLFMRDLRGRIKEGCYVYYDDSRQQSPFTNGNRSKIAKSQFNAFNSLRDELIERYIDPADDQAIEWTSAFFSRKDAKVTSYHINVGHGNCSAILLQKAHSYRLWMVDCSILDNKNWVSYQRNLEECLDAIANRLGLRNRNLLHVERFFLTHCHFDHYNGLDSLIDWGIVDKTTICYINLYYQMARPKYTRILGRLRAIGVRFIEPVSKNSMPSITFLYPERRAFRHGVTICGPTVVNPLIVKKPNDSSSVILFQFGNKSMVFPGDLEQKGFENMMQSREFCPSLCWINYYVVSHHGSINGHPSFPFGSGRCPRSLLSCICKRINKAILMGRDGAFPGIYDLSVVDYWKDLHKALVFSEKDDAGTPIKYVELKWESGSISYFK